MTDISKISAPIIKAITLLIKKYSDSSYALPVVAIGGCSAVGKSEFTKILQSLLQQHGIRALILKQDNFMNPLEVFSNYTIHPHLDHKKIHTVLKNIKKGHKQVISPTFDLSQLTVTYNQLDLTNIDIILFEGTYVLSTDESYNFLGYSDLRIFIDASEKDIIKWNWQRENSDTHNIPRSRDRFDQDTSWNMNDYHVNILPTKVHADFVIEKNHNHDYSLPLFESE